jgi:predicted phosphodiesterase
VTIVLLSDTHELHRDVEVPPGDLLIHAGDITFFSRQPAVLTDFNMWLGELPHCHKVVIPGNHDSLLLQETGRNQITNAHLLINSGIDVEGLRIWGSPVTPYGNVAFGIPGSPERTAHWSAIPEDLDILVTHGPPHRVLDCAPGETHHDGDPELRAAVIQKRCMSSAMYIAPTG